jgi:hypothetical protein
MARAKFILFSLFVPPLLSPLTLLSKRPSKPLERKFLFIFSLLLHLTCSNYPEGAGIDFFQLAGNANILFQLLAENNRKGAFIGEKGLKFH